MSDARVWLASPGEAADVSRLMIAFRNWWKRDSPDDDAFARGVERLLADENTDFLLGAIGDGEPSAVCQLRFRFSLWWDAPDCLLEDLFVGDAARRHGLGEAMVNAAVERARERGCRRVELDTNETNAPAIALYERLGFSSYSDEAGGHNRFMRRHL